MINNIKIQKLPIVAKTRKISDGSDRTKVTVSFILDESVKIHLRRTGHGYTLEALEDLKAVQGIDIEAELMRILNKELCGHIK